MKKLDTRSLLVCRNESILEPSAYQKMRIKYFGELIISDNSSEHALLSYYIMSNLHRIKYCNRLKLDSAFLKFKATRKLALVSKSVRYLDICSIDPKKKPIYPLFSRLASPQLKFLKCYANSSVLEMIKIFGKDMLGIEINFPEGQKIKSQEPQIIMICELMASSKIKRCKLNGVYWSETIKQGFEACFDFRENCYFVLGFHRTVFEQIDSFLPPNTEVISYGLKKAAYKTLQIPIRSQLKDVAIFVEKNSHVHHLLTIAEMNSLENLSISLRDLEKDLRDIVELIKLPVTIERISLDIITLRKEMNIAGSRKEGLADFKELNATLISLNNDPRMNAFAKQIEKSSKLGYFKLFFKLSKLQIAYIYFLYALTKKLGNVHNEISLGMEMNVGEINKECALDPTYIFSLIPNIEMKKCLKLQFDNIHYYNRIVPNLNSLKCLVLTQLVQMDKVKEKKFLRQLFKSLALSQIEKIQMPYADDEMISEFSENTKYRILKYLILQSNSSFIAGESLIMILKSLKSKISLKQLILQVRDLVLDKSEINLSQLAIQAAKFIKDTRNGNLQVVSVWAGYLKLDRSGHGEVTIKTK